MDLALALGKTEEELLTNISSAEITKWLGYYAVTPFGEERADFRVAQLTALMANRSRDTKQHPKPFEALDFMPYSEKPVTTGRKLMRKIKAVLRG